MCPACECVLAFSAKLDRLTVLSQNVSRMWVCSGIPCQTALADSALSKCVQDVSVFWHFLPDCAGWQCSLKMCPGCECVLALPARLCWLTVLSQNVSRMWVCFGISCQTGLADSALSNCVQTVSVSLLFWQTGLADSALSKCIQTVSVSLLFW